MRNLIKHERFNYIAFKINLPFLFSSMLLSKLFVIFFLFVFFFLSISYQFLQYFTCFLKRH